MPFTRSQEEDRTKGISIMSTELCSKCRRVYVPSVGHICGTFSVASPSIGFTLDPSSGPKSDPNDEGRGHDAYMPRSFWRVTPYDSCGRRAMWIRSTHIDDNHAFLVVEPEVSEVELRSGREGDDAQIILKEGDVLTRAVLSDLTDLVMRARDICGVPHNEPRYDVLEPELPWSDVSDEWTEAIQAAHPIRSQSYDEHAVAMQMVGHRRSKGDLIELVNWLLVRLRGAPVTTTQKGNSQ
jgi:hypothetical protein